MNKLISTIALFLIASTSMAQGLAGDWSFYRIDSGTNKIEQLKELKITINAEETTATMSMEGEEDIINCTLSKTNRLMLVNPVLEADAMMNCNFNGQTQNLALEKVRENKYIYMPLDDIGDMGFMIRK